MFVVYSIFRDTNFYFHALTPHDLIKYSCFLEQSGGLVGDGKRQVGDQGRRGQLVHQQPRSLQEIKVLVKVKIAIKVTEKVNTNVEVNVTVNIIVRIRVNVKVKVKFEVMAVGQGQGNRSR